MSRRQRLHLLGLALIALAGLTALSLVPLGNPPPGAFPEGNIMGVLGRGFAGAGIHALGAGFLLVPLLLALGAAVTFEWVEPGPALRWGSLGLGLVFLLPTLAALFSADSGFDAPAWLPPAAAGWLGRMVALPLDALVGWFGALLTLVIAAIGLSVATIGWNPAGSLLRYGRTAVGRFRERSAGVTVSAASEPAATVEPRVPEVAEPADAAPKKQGRWTVRRKPARKRAVTLEDAGDPTSSDLPTLTLLTPAAARPASVSEGELDRLGDVLIRTLDNFNVKGEITGRTTGPVVTQFEVKPADGVKVNRIAALDADLALALRAASIRIVAPIPGKGAVGVEVPNPEPEIVQLREILESTAFQRSRGQLPVALGKDLTGQPYVADLVRMPHLLIAGATGSGKSVCINTLITSLVYRHTPESLRLLLIDPKMVELSMYADLPHLRHRVVTDPHDAATVLKWAVMEMERRYSLLSENGARSAVEFNKRLAAGHAMRRIEPQGEEDDPDRWVYDEGPLPTIVVVVDELADLMMTVQAEIERPLAQLAQKARAIGIHLIVATQRPSVNVITGLIKANFPCRIAFRVASKVDSRTILDQNGADALLGNGDLLFLPPGASDPVRIQGAFISTDDTEKMMAWYRKSALEQAAAREDDILEYVRSREATAETEGQDAEFFERRDAYFRQAAEICIQHQQGSTSLLQRKLRIGYGRAARIVDQLHQAGVLGPPDGSKPREVLVGLESIDNICRDE
ncbi:MAG: DNA translocase FtsK [Gemmatimonadota bacterium]|jgi:S-DNA-T family DNA segregation ATPase FtsK/SpoIIIE